MRRVARESVFQLVFEFTFYGAPNEDTLAIMSMGANLTDDDREYISSTYGAVIAHFDELKATLASNLDNYSIDRLYRPDLVALVLAIYELSYSDEPSAVIISEAVALAKKFGSDNSGRFVNGVLAKIVKQLRQ